MQEHEKCHTMLLGVEYLRVCIHSTDADARLHARTFPHVHFRHQSNTPFASWVR
jgi:hypothetical protein